MPLARIYTNTPQEAEPLVESLRSEGYKVEVVAPGTACRRRADLEFNLDLGNDESMAGTAAMAPSEPVVKAEPVLVYRAPEPEPPSVRMEEVQPPSDMAEDLRTARELPDRTQRAAMFVADVRGSLGEAFRDAWHHSSDALEDMRDNVASMRGRTGNAAARLTGWFRARREEFSAALAERRTQWAEASARRRKEEEAANAFREQQREAERMRREQEREAERIRREAAIAQREREAALRKQPPVEQPGYTSTGLPAVLSEGTSTRAFDSHLDQINSLVETRLEAATHEVAPLGKIEAPDAVPIVEEKPAPVVAQPPLRSSVDPDRRPRVVRMQPSAPAPSERSRQFKVAFAAAGATAALLILGFVLGSNLSGRDVIVQQPAPQPSGGVTVQAGQPEIPSGMTTNPQSEKAVANSDGGGVTIEPNKGATIRPKPRPRRVVEDEEIADDVVIRHHRRVPPTNGQVASKSGVKRFTDVD